MCSTLIAVDRHPFARVGLGAFLNSLTGVLHGFLNSVSDVVGRLLDGVPCIPSRPFVGFSDVMEKPPPTRGAA